MNTTRKTFARSLIVTASIALLGGYAGSTLAGGLGEFDVPDAPVSLRSRAEVRAEAVQAAAARLHAAPRDEFSVPSFTNDSTLTLTARRAEARKVQVERFHVATLDATM